MIDMPIADVKRKIIEQKGLSESEINEKIQEKLKQLSGLISEDGAAHIVANDLGVTLFKTEGALKIKELTTAAKAAMFNARVLRKYEVREFDKNGRKGKVANMVVGDETGRIRLVFWNDQTDLFEKLQEQDTIRIKNPYVKENNGQFEVHLNDRSNVDINPDGVSVTMPAQGGVRPSRELKYLKDLKGDEENVEVLGTIVQVFDTRFFDVCPECNKRIADNNHCPVHGEVTPSSNYVTGAFLDDGTGNIRVTFWRNQTQHLFGLKDEEIQQWKEHPENAESHKHDLLGEIVKIIGRCKKNEQFDRTELTASLIFKDVDPEKELARLEEKAKTLAAEEKKDIPVVEKVAKAATDDKPEVQVEKADEVEVEKEATTETKEAEEVAAEEVEPKPVVTEEREVKPEDIKFSSADEIENPVVEEAISLDELDELDESEEKSEEKK